MNQTYGSNIKLPLQKCTSKQKCKRCDVVYIMINYVVPLMQCLTNDLREYNMQLITSKCLNSAVAIMFFFLGKKGLKHAQYCDSNALVTRAKDGIQDNVSVFAKMRSSLLHKNIKSRYVNYILFNDGYFPLGDGQIYFPGHVFIVEKVPSSNGREPSYNLYQSYINKYDLKGYYEQNKNTFKYTYQQMKNLLEKLNYILNAPHWDAQCVRYWKDFTFVDTINIQGAVHQGKLFVCFSHDKLVKCVENIEKYTKDKLKDIKNYPHKHEIYGKAEYYKSDNGIKPLSYAEMQNNLHSILHDIKNGKSSSNII